MIRNTNLLKYLNQISVISHLIEMALIALIIYLNTQLFSSQNELIFDMFPVIFVLILSILPAYFASRIFGYHRKDRFLLIILNKHSEVQWYRDPWNRKLCYKAISSKLKST